VNTILKEIDVISLGSERFGNQYSETHIDAKVQYLQLNLLYMINQYLLVAVVIFELRITNHVCLPIPYYLAD
jgi:hypothetical protein